MMLFEQGPAISLKRTRRLPDALARDPRACITLVPPPFASTPSARTLHAELLLLCARIGYSPHMSL
jgi:hypothetical protein